MEIQGRLDIYKCSWGEHGWTYARPVIRKKYKILGFNIWRIVWDKSPTFTSRREAETMKPDDMIRWFNSAIAQYEDYTEAWDKYRK